MFYSGTMAGSTKFSRPFNSLFLNLNLVPAGAGRQEEAMVAVLRGRIKLSRAGTVSDFRNKKVRIPAW